MTTMIYVVYRSWDGIHECGPPEVAFSTEAGAQAYAPNDYTEVLLDPVLGDLCSVCGHVLTDCHNPRHREARP